MAPLSIHPHQLHSLNRVWSFDSHSPVSAGSSPPPWLFPISLHSLLATNLLPNAIKHPTPPRSRPPLSLHLTQKLLKVPVCLSMLCPQSQHVYRTLTLFTDLPFTYPANCSLSTSSLYLHPYIHPLTCYTLYVCVIHIIYIHTYIFIC